MTASDDNTPVSLELRPLPGSERQPAPGVSAAGRLAAEQPIEATIVLRRKPGFDVSAALAGSHLTAAEASTVLGADAGDLELVTATLTGLGVDIVSVDAASRRLRVSATAATMAAVFGAQLEAVNSVSPAGSEVQHRHRTGGLMVPAVLDGVVTAVLGLDDRPQARAEFRIAAANAVSVSYTPLQLAQIYKFPPATTGKGQTIAIIELGGGFAQAELDTYFASLGITGPKVTAVGVDGAQNVPGGDPQGADGEVLLDIEVAGALSPGANIVVYFAPNTDAGFVDAVSQAAHATPTPTSMSISWGQNEDTWTSQARTALDDAFVDAAALGITVTAAAGDNGSTDGATDGRDHADFPSSSPHVLGCGGTSLQVTSTTHSIMVKSETVWNNGVGKGATGGGVSDVFSLPSWQTKAGVPTLTGAAVTGGRGIPDVSAVADPATGYEVLVDGKKMVYGGTSAVAPLWAALIARLAEATGEPFGLLQPTLYALAAGFRDVTVGDNGSYSAKPGWDACTGLGVPDGTALLAALANVKR